MSHDSLTVSMLQFDVVHSDAHANFTKIERLVEGKLEASNLLVLPEMFHCGFVHDPTLVAQSMSGEVVQWMISLARTHQLGVVGSVVILEQGLYYNRLIFAFPNGDVQFYNKRHLFRMGDENKFFTSGNDRVVIEYLGWRIRPLICYDLRFPVWSRNQNDYDLLVYVANWPRARQKAWDVLLAARAIENQCFVVGVNRVGFDGSNHYTGGTTLINFKGQPLASANVNKESVVTATIKMEQLTKYKTDFPTYLDSDDFSVL